MTLRILFTLLFPLLVSHGFCQKINYLDIRFSIFHLPSGEPDSTTLWDTIHNLESLDTNNIRKNITVYYTDLGWAYWLLCNMKDTAHEIDLSLKAYQRALFHSPRNSEALWHCSLAYYHEGQCEKAKFYMKSFKKHTQVKYWKTECIEMVETNCQQYSKSTGD